MRPQFHQLAAAGAIVGAVLGLLAGIVELTVGPQIRSWVGNKMDTTRLGLATIALSLIALAAAIAWLRRHPSTGTNLLVASGLFAPGLIGFTTVGRLWYAPGVLLVLASVVISHELRTEGRDVRSTLSAYWLAGLTAVLAAFYIILGATALGVAGILGIAGGLLVIGVVATQGKLSLPISLPLLVLGALPFAVFTWWSVATPLIAILLLAFGAVALCAARRPTIAA